MKLKHVLDTADKANVLEIILKSYSSVFNLSIKTGKDQDVFSRAYDTLEATTPKDSSDIELAVRFIEGGLEEGDSPYVVYGLEPDADSKLKPWGLSYLDWSEWLAMEVSQETILSFTPDEIVAHCLWEMMMFADSVIGRAAKDGRDE